jgi:hypothetical protein
MTVEHEYLFDVKLFAAIRVKAASQQIARALLKEHIDGMSCNGGAWPNGEPILFEASMDDEEGDDLIEVDGEPVE